MNDPGSSVLEGREHEEREASEDDRLRGPDGLIQLSRLVQAIFSNTAELHGLTPVQAKLLCILVGGPRGMAELARLFGVERAALTGLIDRAERRGLVSRSSVPGDRRAVSVGLTDGGRQAAVAFHASATTQLDDLLSPLTPAQHKQFRTALAKVIAGAPPAETSGLI